MTPPLASGCPDESQHTLNEPATVEEELPEPTSNEPTAPPPEADEESDPEPIKNNEGMPTEPPGAGTDGGAGESETAPE